MHTNIVKYKDDTRGELLSSHFTSSLHRHVCFSRTQTALLNLLSPELTNWNDRNSVCG